MNSLKYHDSLISLAYDAGAEEEASRLASSPMGEFEKYLVSKTLMNNLPSESVIIDIGSGPGIHAEYFLNKGHYVGCVDLSCKSLEMFCNRVSPTLKDRVLFHEVSCATELDWIEDDSADAVLLLGPLYHLEQESSRIKVLKNCHRILKENGLLLAMFMSPYSIVHPHLLEQARVTDVQKNKEHYVSYTKFKGFSIPQYRCWPREATILTQAFFSIESVMNTAPMKDYVSEIENMLEDWPENKTDFFSYLEQVCTDEQEINSAHQYLMFLKKEA